MVYISISVLVWLKSLSVWFDVVRSLIWCWSHYKTMWGDCPGRKRRAKLYLWLRTHLTFKYKTSTKWHSIQVDINLKIRTCLCKCESNISVSTGEPTVGMMRSPCSLLTLKSCHSSNKIAAFDCHRHVWCLKACRQYIFRRVWSCEECSTHTYMHTAATNYEHTWSPGGRQ